MRLFAWVVLSLWPQDTLESLIEKLRDADPALRDQAERRILERFEDWSASIRARSREEADVDLRGRLSDILARGGRRALQRDFEALLPDRVRRGYPKLAADLAGVDSAAKAPALAALGRSPGDPYRDLFLSRGEARRCLPALVWILGEREGATAIRCAWIRVVAERPDLLEDPGIEKATQALFRDPSEKVRSAAIYELRETVLLERAVPELLPSWDLLEINTQYVLIHVIAKRRIAAAYPFLVAKLDDPEWSERVASQIASLRIEELASEVVRTFARGRPILDSTMAALGSKEAVPEILKRLADPRGDHVSQINLLRDLKADRLGDAVAPFLASPAWRSREAALRYLKEFGEPRHAAAVAQSLRDSWDNALDDKANHHFFPDTFCYELLVRWKAHEEIERLIPLMTAGFRGHVIGEMIVKAKPPGAAPRLGLLLEEKDPALAARALGLLADLGASDEARKHGVAIGNLLGDAKVGNAVAESVGRLGLREFLPEILELSKGPERRGVTALRLLWTRDEKLAALRSGDPATRNLGMSTVREDEWKELGDELKRLARDPDGGIRASAGFWLCRVDAEGSAPLILEMLEGPDWGVSANVAQFLEFGPLRIPPERAERLLKHPVGKVRQHALFAIPRRRLEEDRALLVPFFEDPDPEVREAARLCNRMVWGILGPGEPVGDYLASEQEAARLYHNLRDLVKEVPPEVMAPALLKLLEAVLDGTRPIKRWESWHPHGAVYDKPQIAHQVCQLLGSYGDEKAEPVLLKLLSSDDAAMRQAALAGLGGVPSRTAVPRLLELLATKDGDAAAEALGRMGEIPRELLQDGQGAVVVRALRAVRMARRTDLFEDVTRLTRSENQAVRTVAIQTLGALAGPKDAGRLMDLAYTPVAQDRAAFLRELKRFDRPDLAPRIAEFIDDEEYVAWEAVDLLGRLRVRGYEDRILARARSAPPPWSGSLALKAGEAGIREHAPKFLEDVGPSVEQGQWNRTLYAAEALAIMKSKEHLSAFAERVRPLPPVHRSILIPYVTRAGGTDAVPFLLDQLGDADKQVRRAAARALADVSPHDHREAVGKVLRDLFPKYSGWEERAAILKMELAEVARGIIGRTDPRDATNEDLAVAARLGIPEARPVLKERLGKPRVMSEPVLHALNVAWNPRLLSSVVDHHPPEGPQSIEEGLDLVRRAWGKDVSLSEASARGMKVRSSRFWWRNDSSVGGFVLGMCSDPYPRWSYLVREDGTIQIDEFEKVRAAWLERLFR